MLSNQERYTAPAIALHWLIALMMLCLFVLGLYMADQPPSPGRIKLFTWHKSFGVTVFVLALVRLAWRLGHRPPALPQSMVEWQKKAAHLAHWALYGLMFAIPISGWVGSAAKGFPTVWFGLFALPNPVSKDVALGKQLSEVHEVLNFIMIGLVILHVLAALKHHFIDRDGVLDSMRPQHGKA